MLRDVLPLRFAADGLVRTIPPVWRKALARLAIVMLALFAAFLVDWAAMADQWWNSSTYNHIVLVPAIIGWLVWIRAGELIRIEPEPWWPGLALAVGAMLLWVLGALADLATARQLGTVLVAISAVIAVLGPRVGAGLAFPLAYCLFLVPIGDEFVPMLQTITAKITIALVHLSGIPATINGVFIDTPAGLFEVAEACSGVKFLVAMIAFGVLVANVCFVSWRRRIVFLAACVIVPILANGVRAWGTIYAAQFLGIEAAAGFDHIVYGWFFFAAVLAIMLAGSWRFFDRAVDDPPIDGEAIAASPLLSRVSAARTRFVAIAAVMAVIVIAGQAWARAAERLEADVPETIALPQVTGWRQVDYAPQVWWEPRAIGSNHRLLGRYADENGHNVDVFVAVFAVQRDGSEAGGYGQGALVPDSGWSWLAPGPKVAGARSERLLAQGSVERLALTWYRTGNLLTGSNARLKLATMQQRLLLRAQPTTVLILSAEGSDSEATASALDAFRRDAGPVDKWIDRIVRLR